MAGVGVRIYLDTCCLNRPFDTQADARIHLETEAVKTILDFCEQGQWQLISSEVLELEISRTPNPVRQKYTFLLLSSATVNLQLNSSIIAQAKELEGFGLKAFDALHLACAISNADVLLTVDDKFLKKAQTINTPNIRVAHPLRWLEETLYDFYS